MARLFKPRHVCMRTSINETTWASPSGPAATTTIGISHSPLMMYSFVLCPYTRECKLESLENEREKNEKN